MIGLYKAELIKPRRPWKGLDDLEIATAEWVDWFQPPTALFEYCDDLTPVEAETGPLRSPPDPSDRRSLKLGSRPDSPGRFTLFRQLKAPSHRR